MNTHCEICEKNEATLVFPLISTKVCSEECGQHYWKTLSKRAQMLVEQVSREKESAVGEFPIVRDQSGNAVYRSHQRVVEIGAVKFETCRKLRVGFDLSNEQTGAVKDQGKRDTQEDYGDFSRNKKKGRSIIAVYDGHGGDLVAKTLANGSEEPTFLPKFLDTFDSDKHFLSDKDMAKLKKLRVNLGLAQSPSTPVGIKDREKFKTRQKKNAAQITKQINKITEKYEKKVELTFTAYDGQLFAVDQLALPRDPAPVVFKKSVRTSGTGSTATIAALQTSKVPSNDAIYLSWLGDSTAAIYSKGGIDIETTLDHDARLEDARNRAKPSFAEIDLINNKIFAKGQALSLSVSRSFGDFFFKREFKEPNEKISHTNGPVIAVPGTKMVRLSGQDEHYIIVASDGLWNFLVDLDTDEKIKAGIRESSEIRGLLKGFSMPEAKINSVVDSIANSPEKLTAFGSELRKSLEGVKPEELRDKSIAAVDEFVSDIHRQITLQRIKNNFIGGGNISPTALAKKLLDAIPEERRRDNICIQIMRVAPLSEEATIPSKARKILGK